MVDIKKYYRGIAIINFIKDEIARPDIEDGFYSCKTFHTSGCDTCPMKLNGQIGAHTTQHNCALILLSELIRFIKMQSETVVLP